MTLSKRQTRWQAGIALAVVILAIVVLALISSLTPGDAVLAKAKADSSHAATIEARCKAQANSVQKTAPSTPPCAGTRVVTRPDSVSGAAKLTCQGCNLFFDGWELTIPRVRYLLLCLSIAFLLRVLQSILRAWAVQRGDFPQDKDDKGQPSRPEAVIERFWRAFGHSFGGFSYFREHTDLWLQYLINLFELAVYPVLLVLGQGLVIGAWLGIRTAGGWTGFAVSRTSFMRFLLVSLLTLSVSYFCLSRYIVRLPCSPP